MLLRSRLGFWKHVTEEKMPDTRFLVQNDADFDELVKASALPSFTSDRVIQREGEFPNRIKIPIEDTEANVVYSLYYRLKDQKFLANYLRTVL